MKKITSVIAITLLAALLLTACDFIPMKKDFSQYGFTFTIAGKVTENEGNEFGNASFVTKYGEMTFFNYDKNIAGVAIEGVKLAMKLAKYTEPVGDNATLYTFAAADGVIKTVYLIEIADGSAWQISFSTPEADYDKDALEKVFKSVKFVTAQ